MLTENNKEDICEWDVENWGKAIQYWEANLESTDLRGKKVLDLGGRNGGLSLYWALMGADVICSDLNGDGFEKARKLHEKYGVSQRITYQIIDATSIPFEDEFDIISFKSVLGGVGYHNQFCRQKKMMDSIYEALKKGGTCYFAENLVASPLHQFFRKKFTGWGASWRYINLNEIPTLVSKFSAVYYRANGFLGVFGRKKLLSKVLGKIDSYLDEIIDDRNKYIVSCVLKK